MEEIKSPDIVQKIIAILLAVISCFGVIVPAIGFFYYLGYLSAFGLDTNIFPASLWDLWKYSFYASLELALGSMKYLFFVGLIAVGSIFTLIYLLILTPYFSYLGRRIPIAKFLKMEIKLPSTGTDSISNLLRWLYLSSKFLLSILIG